MENERIQMNTNETDTMDSVTNLLQVNEGMSGSLFGILSLTDLLSSNSLAMGISTVSLLAESTEIKTGVASLIEAASSAISPVGILADGMINLLGYADQMCNGIAMIAENTQNERTAVFISVPNEGARYGKPGPTKIRAEPYTKIKRGSMKSKSKSRSRLYQAASALKQKVRCLVLRTVFIHDVVTSKTTITIAGNLYDIFSTDSS